jgi:hypothetical protein
MVLDAAYSPAVEIGFGSSIVAEKSLAGVPGGGLRAFMENSTRVILPFASWTYTLDQRKRCLDGGRAGL